jgi:hypothetical protein
MTRSRAPLGYVADIDPVADASRAEIQGSGSVTRDASHQPTSSGRFAPTIEPERPARRRARASHQPPNLTRRLWRKALAELIARSTTSAKRAHTPEGRRLAGVMAEWLKAQRDVPPA